MWGRRGSQGGFPWGKAVGIEFPRISRNSPGRGREEYPRQKGMRVEALRPRCMEGERTDKKPVWWLQRTRQWGLR